MKTISRYIMTLALLLTAVGGAWAQEAHYRIDVNFDNSYDPYQTIFICVIENITDPEAEIKGTLELSVDDVSKGSIDVNSGQFEGYIDPLGVGNHTWSAVFHPEGGGDFSANGAFTIDKAYTQIVYNGSTSIDLGVDESTEVEVYLHPNGAGEISYSSSDASVASIAKKDNSYNYIIQAKAAGTATITFSYAGNDNYQAAEEKKITVTVLGPAEPAIDVTLNDDKTEATMESMPTYDVNFSYELVRDMSVQMQAQVGDDATKQPRYRVKKNEQTGLYEPAEMDMMQVLELFSVYDGIEGTTLAPKNYLVNIWAVDDEGNPTGDAMNFTNFTFAPGRYCVTASALLDAPYDGTTAPSNIFELFQGYQVVIPAGEYVTYYKDEALYVEDEDAKLYTITTVGNETATATELTVAAANTPLLVKNNAAQAKTILLIPTTSATPDEVTPYEGFKGTLQATQIAASTATQNNYALNGKEFVWVMEAIDIAANRAWLEVPAATTNGRALQIVFGDVTGMSEELRVKSEEFATAQWYDLNGRKLQAAPTKKGVYILNGKKVVVK